MKGYNISMYGAIAGLVLSLPLAGLAAEGKPGSPSGQAGVQSQRGPSVAQLVYKPPRKGAPAPGSRRGGGSRGMNKSVPVISLLAPDHVGLTLQEQPVLFWFTPTKQSGPVEFTLTVASADTPVVEAKLPLPTQPGLQQIRLSDYKVRLNFSDGAERVVDFEPFLSSSQNPMIRAYLDPQKFEGFRLEHGDLIWDDYELCFPIANLYEGRL